MSEEFRTTGRGEGAPADAVLRAPRGTDVVVSGPGRIRARIFVEGEEIKPRQGSYLDALNSFPSP